MYAEEAGRLAPEVAARATVSSDGVVSELHLPVLDLMPPPLRERGLRFLRDSAGLLRGTPGLLLPHLLVESPPYQPDNLRFARLRTPRPFSDDRLGPVTDQLFTADTAAAVRCRLDTAVAAVRTWETTS